MATDKHRRANRRHPVIPFRCPTPEHRRQVVEAAHAEGLTVSEWVRRAVADRLAGVSKLASLDV